MVLTSLVCAGAVAIVVLLESTLDARGGPPLPALWWVAYVLFVAVLLAIHCEPPRLRRVPDGALLLALIVLAVSLALLFPAQAWIAVLFVLTVATSSFYWRPRAVASIIAAQTAVIVLMGLLAGWSTVDIVTGVLAFGNVQAFGALVVFAARSEGDARRELAVAHTELLSTATLLELTTKEAERLRISRDLHDMIGHDLTALSLELEVAAHLTTDSAGHQHVTRARSNAKDLLGTVRAAVGEMRTAPPSLAPALRALAADIPGLDVSLRVEERDALGADQTVVILRSVQEAITNTLRHSDARRVQVSIEADEDGVRLIVADDGGGTARIVPGHGLTGMRERFEALGGSLDVRSGSGEGFVVAGRLPRGTAPRVRGRVGGSPRHRG